MNSYIPLIYIYYGLISDYIHINIELASRQNKIIILTTNVIDNEYYYDDKSSRTSQVKFENLSFYMDSAEDFRPYYKHMVVISYSSLIIIYLFIYEHYLRPVINPVVE